MVHQEIVFVRRADATLRGGPHRERLGRLFAAERRERLEVQRTQEVRQLLPFLLELLENGAMIIKNISEIFDKI